MGNTYYDDSLVYHILVIIILLEWCFYYIYKKHAIIKNMQLLKNTLKLHLCQYFKLINTCVIATQRQALFIILLV